MRTSDSVERGSSVSLPNAIMNYRTLAGWYTEATGGTRVGGSGSSYTPTASTTLYAHWNTVSVTVSFNANGGSVSTASKVATAGYTIGDLPTPTWDDDHAFLGWYTDASGGTQYTSSTIVTFASSFTLYAHWVNRTYTIRFNVNGGTGSMYDVTTAYTASVTLTKNAFARTGYTFSGWATSAAGAKAYDDQATVSRLSSGVGSVVNLYAVWTANTYRVHYAGSTIYDTATYDIPFAVADVSASGYTFGGWTVSGHNAATAMWGTGSACETPVGAAGSVSSTGTVYFINLTPTANATVTLTSKLTAKTYIVTLVPGTSHSVSPTSLSVAFGSAYGTLPTPTSSVLGEVFTGWYTDSSGGTQVTSETVVSTASNHSLYARFVTGSYTVRFNSNGGDGAMADMAFSFGETKALTTNAYVKQNSSLGYLYRFLGWSKSASASSKTYSDMESVSNLASSNGEVVVLYAVWASPVKITVNSNDTSLGTVSDSTGYYFPGDSLTVTATITDATHIRFLGWYVGNERVSTSAQYTLTVPAADTTYEAKFRDVRHYIQIQLFDPLYGSVTLTVAGTEADDPTVPVACLEGDTVQLVATPAYNYDVEGWTVRGTLNKDRIFSFTVTSGDETTVVCMPSFKEKPKYALTVTPQGRGAGAVTLTLSDAYGHSWTGEGAAISATAYVGLAYTAKVELPGDDPNLEFKGWSLDGASVEATKKTYTLTRTEATDAALVVNVYSKAHALNVSFTPQTAPFYGYVGGSVGETALTELTGVTVVDGQWVTVKATPSALRSFARWEIDGIDDSIDAEVRFQVSASMPDTVTATAVFESRSRNALTATKENGALGSIKVSYEDVLDPDTGEAVTTRVYLANDASGGVTNYVYAGVPYLFEATLAENRSEITGNPLTEFDGWYAKVNGEWVKQTSDLSCSLADTPTVKAVFAYRTLYEGTLSAETGGTVSWSDGTKPDVVGSGTAGPKWLDGRSVTLVGTPSTGYSFSFWRITIGGVPQATVTESEVTVSPTGDFTATAVFERTKCPVTLRVDEASEVAAGGVAAYIGETELDETALQALLYGVSVTYKALTKDGYSFAGWYSDGALLSSEATYAAAPLTGAVEVVARYSATVTLAVSSSATAAGTVAATASFDEDGNPVFTGGGEETASCTVVLGERCGIRATATSGAFGSWHDASDAEFADPLDYEGEDALTVTDNVSLVARLINENDYTYAALFNGWADETEKVEGVVLGVLSMTKGSPVDETAFNAGIAKAGYSGAAVTGAYAYYRFLGTKKSALSAEDNSGRTFAGWKIRTLSGGSFTDEVTYAGSYVSTALCTILTAYWGTPKPVLVKVSFCNGSRGRGAVMLDGEAESRVETDDGVSAMVMQGKEVSLSTSVLNGYMFAGWFANADGTSPLGKEQPYVFTANVQTIVYAKFTEDRNAIYRWEGLDELKTLRWKSKTYVSSRPFDPSCARVDADGYSVNLKVEMFSSPDGKASAAATKSVEMRSQGARRLVSGRPEKFCAVTLTADCGVNAVAVGTSMGGLAV